MKRCSLSPKFLSAFKGQFAVFLFSTLSLLFFAYKSSAQQSWKETRIQYLRLADDTTKKDSALMYAYKLKEIALKLYGKKSNEYYRSLNSIGFCEEQLKRYEEAKNVWIGLYRELEKKQDPTFNCVKSDVAFNLYLRIFTYHFKQADSALFFSDAYLKAQANINGKTTRAQINSVTNVALNIEQNFGIQFAVELYKQSLSIRKELFGAKDYELRKNLFDKVDSLFTGDSAHYQYYLGEIANLHCVITETQTKIWTVKQLDSLCLNSLRHFSYESSLLLALESESVVLKDHLLADSAVAYHMHLLGYLFRYKYKVKSLADFFYNASTIKNRDFFVTKIAVADNPAANEIVMQSASQISNSKNSEPILITPVGHLIQVNSVAFSPDRKYLISGSYDHTAKIWDSSTTQLLTTLDGMTGGVLLAKYSPDGKFIMTLSDDNNLKIWSVGGILLKTFTSDKIGLNCADISEDASILLIGCSDGLIRMIDIQSGKELLAMAQNSAPINSIVYSPDYKYILTGSGDGTASVRNATTGNLIKIIYQDDKFRITEASYSLSGKYVAIRCGDNTARVFDVATGTEICKISHKEFLQKLIFSPDEKKLFAFSNEGATINGKGIIKIVDLQTGRQLKSFKNDYVGGATAGCFNIVSNYLITANGNGLIMKIDPDTGKPFAFFKGHSVSSEEPNFSRDGSHLVVPYDDGYVRVWNVKTAKVVLVLQGHRGFVYGAAYNNMGTKILTWSRDSTARVWDASTGKVLYVLESKESVVRAEFSNDDAEIITASNDGIVESWDVATGKPKYKFEAGQPARFGRNTWFCIDPKGRKIITAINVGAEDDNYTHRDSLEKMKIWDMNLGKLLCTIDSKNGISGGYFIDKGKKIFTICADSVNRIFDTETGKMLFEKKFGPDLWLDSSSEYILAKGRDTLFLYDRNKKKVIFSIPSFDVTHAVFSKDDKRILTSSFDNTVKVVDAGTGKIVHTFEPTPGYGMFALFSPDEKVIIGSGGSLKMWDAKNYKMRCNSMDIDSTDYYSQIPSGYYMCTQNAAKLLHYVTKNLEVITFDQLDIKYNRPDKVLEAIGCQDTALIHAYHRAYEKRIKKLGIDTTSFKSGYSVPKADFKNRDQIKPEQKQDQLALHISGTDSTYSLDRFNVWVNNVPVYGIRGVSLKTKSRHNLDTTITLTLSQGQNRVETSVIDVNGTESYHMPLFVNYTPDKPVDTLLHFIGIGIDKFADNSHNLQWSAKDIRDLALKFKTKYGYKCTIDTLFNEQVNTDNVKALKQGLLKSRVNDKVVIAYSGHGLLSKDYDYFLSTYSVNFKKPEQGGLPYDALENLLDSIPARKKLMLIDACHSGELDKDEMNRYTQTAPDRQKNKVVDPGHKKGAEIELTQKSGMSMASSFELMKQLFVNVGKSTGATVISAAGGVQYALEKNDLKNGVFTYSILENMQKNPHVNISALKEYVNKRVVELTAGMQVPTTRNETEVVDWQVW